MKYHVLCSPQTYVLLVLVKDFIFIFVLLVVGTRISQQKVVAYGAVE